MQVTVFELAAATKAARVRRGMPHLGTRIKQGRFDIVECVPTGRGSVDVRVLVPDQSLADAYLAMLPVNDEAFV
jgi:hypothetical protein